MATEPKFVIQGSDYPIPDWISFTMDESEILYDKAGVTLADVDEDTRFTPGLLAALMIVAYMRGNPSVSRKAAEAVVGGIVLADAIEHLFPDSEDEAGPPSPAPSETESPGATERSDGSEPSHGDSSQNDSVTPQASVVPLPTGTPPSDTQPASDQVTSVG